MPQMLDFSPEAKAEWVAFHDRIESQLGSGGRLQDVRDVASKIADNAARVAALFHVFQSGLGPVGADSFRAAMLIVEWHLNEALRFFGELAMPAGLANADCWKRGWLPPANAKAQPTLRPSFGPSDLREKVIMTAAVTELAELGRARWYRGAPNSLR